MNYRNIVFSLFLLNPLILWSMKERTKSPEIDTIRALERLEAVTQRGFAWAFLTAHGAKMDLNSFKDISEQEIARVVKIDQKDYVCYEATTANGDMLFATQYFSGELKGEIVCTRYFEYHGADALHNVEVPVNRDYFSKLKKLFEKSEQSH